MNAAINVSIKGADSENSYRRGHWYADGEHGGRVDMQIHRTGRGKCFVAWNGNDGRSWLRGWRKSGLTEVQAVEFASTKWPQLLEWLNKLEPKDSGGAAAVFSAQVAQVR